MTALLLALFLLLEGLAPIELGFNKEYFSVFPAPIAGDWAFEVNNNPLNVLEYVSPTDEKLSVNRRVVDDVSSYRLLGILEREQDFKPVLAIGRNKEAFFGFALNVVFDVIKSRPDIDGFSRGISEVPYNNGQDEVFPINGILAVDATQVRSGLGAPNFASDGDGILSGLISSPSQIKSEQKQYGASSDEYCGVERIIPHVLRGRVHLLCGRVHALLGDQIRLLPGFGFIFAALAGIGGGLILDNVNPERRLRVIGWCVAGFCLPAWIACFLLGLP